jgi:hypothetical protein
MWGVLALNTVGITVGTFHTTVSTPGGTNVFQCMMVGQLVSARSFIVSSGGARESPPSVPCVLRDPAPSIPQSIAALKWVGVSGVWHHRFAVISALLVRED